MKKAEDYKLISKLYQYLCDIKNANADKLYQYISEIKYIISNEDELKKYYEEKVKQYFYCIENKKFKGYIKQLSTIIKNETQFELSTSIFDFENLSCTLDSITSLYEIYERNGNIEYEDFLNAEAEFIYDTNSLLCFLLENYIQFINKNNSKDFLLIFYYADFEKLLSPYGYDFVLFDNEDNLLNFNFNPKCLLPIYKLCTCNVLRCIISKIKNINGDIEPSILNNNQKGSINSYNLKKAQIDIIKLLNKYPGYTNKQLSELKTVFIAETTIKTHIENTCYALGLEKSNKKYLKEWIQNNQDYVNSL